MSRKKSHSIQKVIQIIIDNEKAWLSLSDVTDLQQEASENEDEKENKADVFEFVHSFKRSQLMI